MLKLSEHQVSAFSGLARENFIETSAARIRRLFEIRAGMADPDGPERMVRLGIDRAAHHDIRSKAAVRSYVDHMVMLGAEFDEDPCFMGIAARLGARGQSDIARMDAVYAEIMPRILRVRGADGFNAFRAAARLRSALADDARLAGLAGKPPAEVMARIYPERAEAIGPERLGPVADHLVALAPDHGLATPEGKIAFVMVALIVGAGFMRDPMIATVDARTRFDAARNQGPDAALAAFRDIARAIAGLANDGAREAGASDV